VTNEIVAHNEKVGGVVCSEAHMDCFRSTLVDCNLGDLGYRGSKLTWSNKRDSTNFVKERLDRAVASPGWCANFSSALVDVLPVSNFDHKPLWIWFDADFCISSRLFCFEAKWNIDEECYTIIQDVWGNEEDGRDSMEDIMQNLSRCKNA
jgi:hypothetical protein